MDTVFGDDRVKELKAKGLIAVMVIEDVADAVPVARALVEGGVTAMELTLRTPSAMDALDRIVREVPEMMAGGLNRRVVEEAIKIGLPFAPGVSTASEIEAGIEMGCRVLKFFPAENMGGLKYLDAVNNPYGFLGLQYIPLGGLNMQNLASWLEKDYILAVGGSWIAPKNLIKQKAWRTIRENAIQAMKVFHDVRG